MKPILFNTDMVRAILDGRKTVTRRPVKVRFRAGEAGYNIITQTYTGEFCYLEIYDEWETEVRRLGAPYQPGDVLYVRETWKQATIDPAGGGYAIQDIYLYKADEPIDTTGMLVEGRWHPSIHMPQDAARIFLRVTNVRVKRLQDITRDGAVREGANPACAVLNFKAIWNSTVKPADRDLYGWAANPFVWVIEFERISREEVGGDA